MTTDEAHQIHSAAIGCMEEMAQALRNVLAAWAGSNDDSCFPDLIEIKAALARYEASK